jgi:hypothetical protein
VDVLSVMCQPELPLTVHEYDEWGDPRFPDQLQQVQRACWVIGNRAVCVLRSGCVAVSLTRSHAPCSSKQSAPTTTSALPASRPCCSRALSKTRGCHSGVRSSMWPACEQQPPQHQETAHGAAAVPFCCCLMLKWAILCMNGTCTPQKLSSMPFSSAHLRALTENSCFQLHVSDFVKHSYRQCCESVASNVRESWRLHQRSCAAGVPVNWPLLLLLPLWLYRPPTRAQPLALPVAVATSGTRGACTWDQLLGIRRAQALAALWGVPHLWACPAGSCMQSTPG